MAGVVFDSCPADLHWNIAVRSMYIAFPNKFIFMIVAILFWFFCIFKYLQCLFRYKKKGMYQVCMQLFSGYIYVTVFNDNIYSTRH